MTVARALAASLMTLLLLIGALAISPPAAHAADVGCKTSKGVLSSTKTCISKTATIETGWKRAYMDSVKNRNNSNSVGSCTATKKITFKATYSTSVSAGLESVILASVSTGLSASLSSEYSTSAAFTVKPGKTVYCERGIETKRFSFTQTTAKTTYRFNKRLQVVSSTSKSSKSGTGWGPRVAQWRIY